MEELEDERNIHPNLWFVEVMTNEVIKEQIYEEIEDPNDMESIIQVLKRIAFKGQGIEGIDGCYCRVQKVKKMLKR